MSHPKEVKSGTGMESEHKAQCHAYIRSHGWAGEDEIEKSMKKSFGKNLNLGSLKWENRE